MTDYSIGDRVAGKLNDQDYIGTIEKILHSPKNVRKLEIRLDKPVLSENGRWCSLFITSEELQKLPNPRDEIQALINEMHAHDGDDEHMHSLRDKILHTALTAIHQNAYLSPGEMRSLANLALETDNFEFREWSA